MVYVIMNLNKDDNMKYYCFVNKKPCWFSINASDKDIISIKAQHERWHKVYGFKDGGLRNNTIGKVEWILK